MHSPVGDTQFASIWFDSLIHGHVSEMATDDVSVSFLVITVLE